MAINFGQRYKYKEQEKNFVSVFIETDTNDANYISTMNNYSTISDELDAYLWLLQNVIDLKDERGSIVAFLEEFGVEDRIVEIKYKGANGKACSTKEPISDIIVEWITEILDMPFDEFSCSYNHGHTLNRLEVIQHEDGEVYEVSYRDTGKVNGKKVAEYLSKMVSDYYEGEEE